MNPKGKLKNYQHLAVFCCHQLLPASLNTDQYQQRYKCVQNMAQIYTAATAAA